MQIYICVYRGEYREMHLAIWKWRTSIYYKWHEVIRVGAEGL